MTNRPTVAAVAALLLPGLVACIPYDHDVTERVAVSGQKVVVTGQTVTEGGGGCGGGDIGGPPVMLISNDAGQSFERVADGGAPIRDLITLDGAFIMLRSDYASFSVLRSTDGHTWDLLGSNDGDGNDLAVFGDDLVVASSVGVQHLRGRRPGLQHAVRRDRPVRQLARRVVGVRRPGQRRRQ